LFNNDDAGKGKNDGKGDDKFDEWWIVVLVCGLLFVVVLAAVWGSKISPEYRPMMQHPTQLSPTYVQEPQASSADASNSKRDSFRLGGGMNQVSSI
jgi:hypothetical protein